MTLRMAAQIADAVLYEGYVLYPYRASAAKNQLRWQTGLFTPRAFAESTGSDPWFMQTECLAEAGPRAALTVHVRCLHVQQRTIRRTVDGDSTRWLETDSMVVGGRRLLAWDEAVVREYLVGPLPIEDGRDEQSYTWVLEGGCAVEPVHDECGRLAAQIVRRREEVVAGVRVMAERCDGLIKVRVRVENVTACAATTLAARDGAVRQSLAGAHAVLALEDGAFVSLLDPAPPHRGAAAACMNVHTWPVLVGPKGSRSVMLSSPIILYDYPAVAPESAGDLCDATEIDEMLMLRVQTLTPDEKREARATDERAARIIDRADGASAGTMSRLHGAVRHYSAASGDAGHDGWEAFLNPPGDVPPDAAHVDVGGVRVGRGSRVRLQPRRHLDSLDLCLAGRLATVEAVYRTLEDTPYVAVILDDDPLGAAGACYRRSLFFHPDEVALLDAGERKGDR